MMNRTLTKTKLFYAFLTLFACEVQAEQEHGYYVFNDRLETRSVIVEDKVQTFMFKYRAWYAVKWRQIKESGKRKCFHHLLLYVDSTPPCLVDQRPKEDLPIPDKLEFACNTNYERIKTLEEPELKGYIDENKNHHSGVNCGKIMSYIMGKFEGENNTMINMADNIIKMTADEFIINLQK